MTTDEVLEEYNKQTLNRYGQTLTQKEYNLILKGKE